MDCGICANTVSEKKATACPSCEYISCETCLRQYFENIPEPACPNCSKVWTREFITLHFKGLYKDFKKMREKFLLDQEKMLLPETQVYAENEKRARAIESDIQDIHKELYEAKRLVERLKQQIYRKATQTLNLRAGRPINTGMRDDDDDVILIEADEKTAKTDFVLFGCPAGDCRGFVTSAENTCGLCRVLVCTKCEIIKTDRHICKPEDVETVKAKKRETKPCPKCHASIYKIEGCDQMWCTQCKTPFSWRTGKVVNERVHNPHFYEWQRQTNGGVAPRVPGDEPCGAMRQIQIGEITWAVYGQKKISRRQTISKFESFHMFVGHTQAELQAPPVRDNKELRVAFLLGEITEETLAKRIQQREKKREKDLEISQIVEMLAQTANDIFRNMVSTPTPERELSDEKREMFSREIDRLVEFVNEQFKIVATKFKIKSREIIYKDGTYTRM